MGVRGWITSVQERTDVDFYTQSLKHTDITILETIYQGKCGPKNQLESYFGKVRVEHEYYHLLKTIGFDFHR